DLRGVLERARSGDADVRHGDETSVRGHDVYELSIVERARLSDERADGLAMVHTLYVDRDDFLPVRVEHRTAGGAVWGSVDFATVERLPAAEAGRELEMSPHPGAQDMSPGR
ncbi:MAG TPA: hypothetical protein VGW75_08360, partial [Solirubrobacteraceae bacterium]|nr:hypothetical protein [Solirubrobacteraceae bacterium]